MSAEVMQKGYHMPMLFDPNSSKGPKQERAGFSLIGRGERIRTSGPYVPNVVLYQAELLPGAAAVIACRILFGNIAMGIPGLVEVATRWKV